MHLIISSYLFNNKATFDKIEIKYKFLTFFDLKKKIKKNYLNECKIIFIHDDNDNLNTIIDLIKNYNKNVQLFFINLKNFYMNDTSTYFLREFTEQYIDKKKLELILKKNDIITIPKIIIGNVFNLDVIISGVCRDISKYIFNTFHKFVYLTQYFKKTKIIIYENDSKDDTLKKLYELKKKFSNLDIIILSEKNIEGKITQRISHARNKILEYIDNHNLNPEYFISIDMDEILSDFKCNSIIHPFKDNLEWSMIGGNSMIYYDMWALRTLNEPNIDFWKNKKDLISGKYITPPQKLINYFFQISEDSKDRKSVV